MSRLYLNMVCRLDEQEAKRAADEFLKQHCGGNDDAYGDKEPRRKPAAAAQNLKNTSAYITVLTTYMACKQLGTRDSMARDLGED